MLTSRMFRDAPARCPICGAPDQTCTGPDPREPVMRILADVPRVGPVYRSREQVWKTDPATGQTTLKYGVGTEIPLAEALRQGVVAEDQLTDEQRRQMAAHGLLPPASENGAQDTPATHETAGGQEDAVQRKGLKRPPKDKMIREGGTVTKGVSVARKRYGIATSGK